MGKKERLYNSAPRTPSLEDVEKIRRSVAEGVERVVRPFVRRLERQSRIPDSEKRRIQSAA